MSRKSIIATCLFIASFAGFADGATLKILTPADAFDSGNLIPNSTRLSTFETYLANNFTDIIEGDLADPQFATGADAFYVNVAAIGSLYTAAELTNLQAIFSGTTRALVLFENNSWRSSNNQVADLLGESFLGNDNGILNVNVSGGSPLIDGVTQIDVGTGGRMTGGEQVVGDVVTLRGPNQNVILQGDIDLFGNDQIVGWPQNDIMAQNTARFLAVPEPSAALLVGLASFGFLLGRRRR